MDFFTESETCFIMNPKPDSTNQFQILLQSVSRSITGVLRLLMEGVLVLALHTRLYMHGDLLHINMH